MARTLLCIAEGHEGAWEGICLDLDIAVQGGSFEEVRRLLNEAVRTYLEDASRENEATRDWLLNRRAPWHVRARYIARLLFSALRPRRRDDGLHGSFEIPCHA